MLGFTGGQANTTYGGKHFVSLSYNQGYPKLLRGEWEPQFVTIPNANTTLRLPQCRTFRTPARLSFWVLLSMDSNSFVLVNLRPLLPFC